MHVKIQILATGIVRIYLSAKTLFTRPNHHDHRDVTGTYTRPSWVYLFCCLEAPEKRNN